jgi:hypothetical protein
MTDTNDINSSDIWVKPKSRVNKPKNNNVVDTSNKVSTPFNNRNINFKINKSNLTSNSNSNPKPLKRIDFMIRDWCLSGVDTEAMCKDYETLKSLVENPNSDKYQDNINCVFDRLTQAWRHDVLDVFKNSNTYEIYNSHSIYKKNNGEGTPFHFMLFPIKAIYQNLNDQRFEDFKKTFNILVDYKFNIFKLRQIDQHNETFLMTVIYNGPYMLVAEDFRNRIYKYVGRRRLSKMYREHRKVAALP